MPPQLDPSPLARPLKPMARLAGASGYPRRMEPRREVRVQPMQAKQGSDANVERKGVKGAVSFSLFGSNPMYCQGAIRNAELMKDIYPSWKMVCFCADDVPRATTAKLRQLGVDVRGAVAGIANAMFHRFCALDDPQFTHVIFRDCDSRISMREARAVNEWLDSGLGFHSLSDHPAHWLGLGGGLWGAKQGAFSSMTLAIINSKLADRAYERKDGYGADQAFLARFVWSVAKKSVLRHDSCCRHLYPEAKPFPDGCKFGDERFCGEIVGADDKPHPTHFQMRCNFMTR